MSKRLKADEFEEQDGWIAKLRDRWFGDAEEEEEEAFGGEMPPQAAQRPRQLDAVQRLHHVEQRRGLPGFVLLQVTEEMEPRGDLSQRGKLHFALLHVVLAQLPDSGGQRLADELHRLGLAYCDQADLSGAAA